MPSPHYTQDQLKFLRDSPHVQKPDNLPSIEQWFESQSDAAQKRQKAHGGFHGTKGEENDRPILGPLKTRQSQTGEEVFLGPKMLIGSSTASRQPKNSPQEPSTAPPTSEFSKYKQDRFGSREKIGWDKNVSRFRDHDQSRQDEESPQENRTRFKYRRNSQDEDDRPTRFKGRGAPDRDGEGDREFGAKRNGFGRSKFEQPWFRDPNKAQGHEEEERSGRSWRDGERRGPRGWAKDDRPEPEPQWVKNNEEDEGTEHTPEDFEKWKERMKSGDKPKTEVDSTSNVDTNTPASAALTSPAVGTPGGESLFGLWSDGKAEKNIDGAAAKKVSAAKAKSSRFAGFFAPKDEISSPAPMPTSPPPQPAAPPSSKEDQAGFEFVMQRLRLGNNSSQGQQNPAFAPPPGQNTRQATDPLMQHEINQSSENRDMDHQPSPRRALTSPMQSHGFPNQGAPLNHDNQRRDGQFLASLMQQVQSPSADDPSHRHGYNPRNSNDLGALLNTFTSKEPSPQPTVSRGPPPGFFNNDRAYSSNQSMDISPNMAIQGNAPPSRDSYDDHSFSPRQHSNPMEELLRQRPPPPQGQGQFSHHPDLQLRHAQTHPNSQYDQGPQLPPWLQAQPQNNRPPSQNPHDGISAPPGFSSMPRDTGPPPGFSQRPLPPGFLPQQGQFPPHQHPHQQPPPQNQQAPHMRNLPPHMQQGPPGFGFPPPGYGPGPPQQSQQQQQGPPQGPPGNGLRHVHSQQQQPGQGQGPLGGGGGGPGYGMPPPQPPQGQYAQYLKQGGGMGAYGGM